LQIERDVLDGDLLYGHDEGSTNESPSWVIREGLAPPQASQLVYQFLPQSLLPIVPNVLWVVL